MRSVLLLVFLGLSISINAQTPTGEEILKRIDQNRIFGHAVSTSTMIVHSRTGDRTIQSKAWSEGNDKAFVEYLAPPREKGKKMLKLEKASGFTPRNPATASSPSPGTC